MGTEAALSYVASHADMLLTPWGCCVKAQDRSMGSPASHKRKAEAAEAGDVQSMSLEGASRSLGGRLRV